MPLPLHTARGWPGWGEGMCRGALSTEACHKGGEVLSREKPQWREVRFLTQGLGGGSSTLKILDSNSLGCLGFQGPMLCL